MDFTAWNWASSFRLHEAACLIAGVMPISKRHPISEELPPQARPILIKLAGAYYEWFFQKKNPERPKSIVLEGILNEDGSLPPFPALADVAGEVVSRDDLHRFLTLMAECGLKSCYDFGPVGKADPPHEIGHQPQAAAPAPEVAESASSEPSNGLATAQIAVIFDGLPYTAENWTRRASDTHWVQKAKLEQGAAGGATSLWCPATLARLIHGRNKGAAKQKTLEALNKRFKNNPALEPWRDAWNQHYEMFNDAD